MINVNGVGREHPKPCARPVEADPQHVLASVERERWRMRVCACGALPHAATSAAMAIAASHRITRESRESRAFTAPRSRRFVLCHVTIAFSVSHVGAIASPCYEKTEG